MNNKDNNLDVINNLELDDEFVKKIMKANNNNEIKDLFKTKNLELDDKQIENIKNIFLGKLKELDDTDIENVSGGLNKDEVAHAAQSGIGHGGAWGMWIGAGVGAAAGVIDASVKTYREGFKSTWDFMKNALVTSVKASLIGGASGAGLGILSGSLENIGDQGSEALKADLTKKKTELV